MLVELGRKTEAIEVLFDLTGGELALTQHTLHSNLFILWLSIL
jgi:hypothetical protein